MHFEIERSVRDDYIAESGPGYNGILSLLTAITNISDTPPDTIPPAEVTNLEASNPADTQIALSWTAPGDDGDAGTANQYDIRYSTSPIDDSNFSSATQAQGEPQPKSAGSAESFMVTGLSPETTYYFAMKTADEAPNWSILSNVAQGATTTPAVSPDPSEWEKYEGNPVLDFLGASGEWDDNQVWDSSVLSMDGEYKMWYSGYDGSNYRIGYATSGVAPAPTEKLAIDPDPLDFGIVRIGQAKTKSITITNNGDEDATDVQITCDNEQVTFEPNTIDVPASGSTQVDVTVTATTEGQLSATISAGNATATLIADIRQLIGDVSGDGTVSAYDAALILQYVVGMFDEFPCETMSIAQNAVPANYTLSIPNQTAKAGESIIVPIQLDNNSALAGGITLNYDASVLRATNLLSNMSANCYWKSKLNDGQIRVAFARLSPAEIVGSELFMIQFDILPGTVGKETLINFEDAKLAGSISTTLNNGIVSVIPDESVLLQNYPNPFNPETWIPFYLSESANVVISIYDVAGQLVRKIGLGEVSAGIYISKGKAIHWDGKNSFGEKVSSGLYFYTLQADNYNATRRMLILK